VQKGYWFLTDPGSDVLHAKVFKPAVGDWSVTTPPTTGSGTGTHTDGTGAERGERGSKSVDRNAECSSAERGSAEGGAEPGVTTA